MMATTSRGFRRPDGWAAVSALVLLGGVAAYLTTLQPALGTIEGWVVAEETGAPIDEAVVRLVPLPSVGERTGPVSVRTDKQGHFRARRLAAGRYDITVTGRARELKVVSTQIRESRPTQVRLQLAPQAPSLEVITHQHVFTPDETIEIACKGFVLGASLRVQCFRINRDEFLKSGGWDLKGFLSIDVVEDVYDYEEAGRLVKGLDAASLAARADLTPLPPQDHPITTADAEGVFYQRVHPRITQPGLYLVSVRADDIHRLTWVAVTDLGHSQQVKIFTPQGKLKKVFGPPYSPARDGRVDRLFFPCGVAPACSVA